MPDMVSVLPGVIIPRIGSSSCMPGNSPGSIGTYDTCSGGSLTILTPVFGVMPVWRRARPPVASNQDGTPSHVVTPSVPDDEQAIQSDPAGVVGADQPRALAVPQRLPVAQPIGIGIGPSGDGRGAKPDRFCLATTSGVPQRNNGGSSGPVRASRAHLPLRFLLILCHWKGD